MHGDEGGFGGSAPNKLMARDEDTVSEHVSDPCRRHGQKLVNNIRQKAPRKVRGRVGLEMEGGVGRIWDRGASKNGSVALSKNGSWRIPIWVRVGQ